MICPTCKAPVPEGYMTCPVCLDRKGRTELVEKARLYVPDLLAGRLHARLWRRRGHSRETHIELFNDHLRSFCGENLHKNFRLLDLMPLDQVREIACSACLLALDGIIAEISPAVVIAHTRRAV